MTIPVRRRLAAAALLLGLSGAAVRSFQNDAPVERAPSLAEIRRAVIDAYLGPDSYDETARLALSDRLDEETRSASCRGVRFVRTAVLERFTNAGFMEVAARMKYPDYAVHLARDLKSPRRLDILLFYYRIEKAPGGVDCVFTFGMLARREDNKGVVLERERDVLYKEAQRLRGNIESRVTADN